MKTIRTFSSFCIIILPIIMKAELKEIPFTIDDRDRIIRTEQKVEALDAKINLNADGMKMEISSLRTDMTTLRSDVAARFDQLFNFLWAIIGIFTTMMVSVFGFAFWDRRLSLAPIRRENERTLNVLREYAKHQPKLLELLKNAGLL